MRVIPLVPLLLFCPVTLAGENAELVERFVSAFNQHDVGEMLESAAPDMKWMSVSGDQLSTQTSTHAELRTAMTGYFESAPGARAEIRSISESGPFVHTVEEAFWRSEGAEKSQCSVATYEILDGRIRNVWYFPAHRCP